MTHIRIDDIPEEGLTIDRLASQEPWVAEAMTAALGDRRRPEDEAHLVLTLVRSGDQVTMLGGVYSHLHPTCDRCLTVYETQQQVPIHIVYIPRSAVAVEGPQTGRTKAGDVEKPEDEVDVNYYDGRQIELNRVLTEQVVLAQPMQYCCRPDCRGLCPSCGKNLNVGACACAPATPTSPFHVLKGLNVLPKKR
ncbi:MAG: DUF177 domain-containing protein [Deltaproteobacteria bacterium]|nr:DUF177 domain-containing protein [Deltaproteobacteria bacterium]